MPTIPVRDIQLHYQVHGRADGQPLILLHGFLATGRMFDPFLEQLGEQYRLYIPDLRGHGRTTNPRPAITHAELARDTAAFAEALELKPAHFCGFSTGGMLLTFLALERPEMIHSLAYTSATYTFDDQAQEQAREIAANASQEWKANLDDMHGPTHGPGYGEKLIALWLESVLRPGELPFSPADLSRIACPTLIIHGDRDPFFPVRVPLAMYGTNPQAELCILPRCGHSLTRERPELFATALAQFLADHPIAASNQ